MQLSDFGRKVSAEAGILRLMDDMSKALNDSSGDIAMLGGGNPAHIPEVTEIYRESLQAVVHDEQKLATMLGNYDNQQGNTEFIQTIVDFFNRHYNMGITPAHVAITPGSQAGYFMLFNLLAGQQNGKVKKILFPLVPEYIGYADQALEPDMFVSQQPKIHKDGRHEFKYHIDFDNLELAEDVAAICVSRPTNPSGNVVTDEEVAKLTKLAEKHDIPLIIDNAYGLPFPGVVALEIQLPKGPNTVLSFSLSKVGLPSTRVGIFIGPPKLMQAMSNANAVINLAGSGVGQYIAAPLVANDRLLEISRTVIKPYYFARAAKAKSLLERHMPDDLPWRMHAYEGSYFFWLWFEGLPITSHELYARLKEHKVLVVPGEYFFVGQSSEKWPHVSECIRMNFARPDAELEKGISTLAQEIQKAYER